MTFPGSDFSKVTSDIATKWDVSADGLTYVFAINPDIKFADGSPITADDIVFSLQRQKYLKGPASWFQDGVKSVEKSGANEVTIRLNSINVDWLFLLTSPFLSIASASMLKANGGTDATDAATSDLARAWLYYTAPAAACLSWTPGLRLAAYAVAKSTIGDGSRPSTASSSSSSRTRTCSGRCWCAATPTSRQT